MRTSRGKPRMSRYRGPGFSAPLSAACTGHTGSKARSRHLRVVGTRLPRPRAVGAGPVGVANAGGESARRGFRPGLHGSAFGGVMICEGPPVSGWALAVIRDYVAVRIPPLGRKQVVTNHRQ